MKLGDIYKNKENNSINQIDSFDTPEDYELQQKLAGLYQNRNGSQKLDTGRRSVLDELGGKIHGIFTT